MDQPNDVITYIFYLTGLWFLGLFIFLGIPFIRRNTNVRTKTIHRINIFIEENTPPEEKKPQKN